MNIAIIGYGKMGHAVERCAVERGHSIALTIDTPEDWANKGSKLKDCDVAVEFSTPATAVENIMRCLRAGVAVVSGTTGWNDRLEEVKNECATLGGTLFVASNFSIGMNIVFELNRQLARMTKGLHSYSVAIKETHHIHKLDAPSGTAIHLAEGIIAEHGGNWELVGSNSSNHAFTQLSHKSESNENEFSLPSRRDNDSERRHSSTQIIPITAVREGEVAGIHEVRYDSPLDTITLIHEAKGREGLALGATLAAEFVVGKKGVFTMHDLIKN